MVVPTLVREGKKKTCNVVLLLLITTPGCWRMGDRDGYGVEMRRVRSKNGNTSTRMTFFEYRLGSVKAQMKYDADMQVGNTNHSTVLESCNKMATQARSKSAEVLGDLQQAEERVAL